MGIRFGDISIKKKLTVTFIALVLLPISMLCFYSYRQVQNSIHAEIINGSKSALEQMKYNIINKVEIIESVSNNLCYNSVLEGFLSGSFEVTPDSIDEYMNKIYPIVKHTMLYHKVSMSDISVYMSNTSIPEGFGYFKHEKRLDKEKWYKDFLDSGQVSAWVIPRKTVTDNPSSLSFVQKIFPYDGRHLGIVVIDIDYDEIFASLNVLDDLKSIGILSPDGALIYSGVGAEIFSEDAKDTLISMPSYAYISGDDLYLAEIIEPLGFKVCMLVSVSGKIGAIDSLTLTLVILILSMLAMIVAFFIILQKIFSAINNQVRLMTKAVHNNLETRLPIGRKDEIGQIAGNFNALLDKINGLLKDLVIKETAHKDAQFKALQFQINPHFIYNTIEIYVNKLALSGNYLIADSIADFGKMLRYTMSRKGVYTTLRMELDYVKSYIGIQKLRYEDALSLEVTVPEELLSTKVIKFILQPIVENSIIHNPLSQDTLLAICIDAHSDEEKLIIEVRDNGRGIEPNRLKELNDRFVLSSYDPLYGAGDNGIGLQNINARLKLFYGSQYHIYMKSSFGYGTSTILTIPKQR